MQPTDNYYYNGGAMYAQPQVQPVPTYTAAPQQPPPPPNVIMAPPPPPVGGVAPQPYPQEVPVKTHDVPEIDVSQMVVDTEIRIRAAFVRKVFLLVFAAFMINFIFTLIAFCVPAVSRWLFYNPAPLVITIIVPIVCIIVLIFVRKKYPQNLIFFFVFAASYSPLLAALTCTQPDVAATCVFLLAAITLVLTLLTFWQVLTERVALLALIACVIIAPISFLSMVFFNSSAAYACYCMLGVFVACIYFVFDLNHTVKSCALDEWCFAAISIYLDLLMLFVYLFMLLGAARR